MSKKAQTFKGIIEPDLLAIDQTDIDAINKLTLTPVARDDVFIFKIKLCDDLPDRVGDKMTIQFLEQVAGLSVGVTGLRDHSWVNANQTARIYAAYLSSQPDGSTAVIAKCYASILDTDFITKVKTGIYKEVSIAFNSSGDTCSICGAPTTKDECDCAICVNGHRALETYNQDTCYNILNKCDEVLEWSFVAVPCQRGAGVTKSKSIGGKHRMRKTELFLKQFMASKSFKSSSKEDQDKLEAAVKTDDSQELSDDDISEIVEENIKLREQVKSLKAELDEANAGREHDKVESIVRKAIEERKPLTQKVVEMALKEMPWDKLQLSDNGEIADLASVLDDALSGYEGLFVTESETEAIGGHDEPDGDEPALIFTNPASGVENPDGDEDKPMLVGKGCGSTKSSPKLGITTKKKTKTTTVKSASKAGISWR